MSDVNVLRALADCDGRAGEPLGKAMRSAADEIERLQAELREARAAMTSARESLYSLTHLLLPDEPGFEKAVDGLEELDAFLAK